MITVSESGLTQTQYDNLNAAREAPDWFAIAHQYNLEFTAFYSGTQSDLGTDFDACVVGTNLYRAAGAIVEVYNGTTWAIVTGFTLPADVKNRPMSLIENGSSLCVFVPTVAGISENIYNGSTWTGWSSVVAESGIDFIAAVTATRVHYIKYDSTQFLSNFKVATYSGSWSTVASDIHWPYYVTSFDAEVLNNTDVIIFSSNTPGTMSAKAVNTSVLKYLVPSGGIVGITYKNGTWSDHFDVDVVDEKSNWRYRDFVRLQVIRNKLFLTAYSYDGTELYPITFYRAYTSKDGRHWSRGEMIDLPSGHSAYGIKYAALGDYIFAISRKLVDRSYSTLYTGLSPSAMQLNLTDKIVQYSRNWENIQQSMIVINNEDNWTTGTILDGSNRILIVHSLGYFVGSPAASVVVQVGITDLDTVENSQDLPRNHFRLVGRDFMGWMNDRTQSEYYKQWEPQLAGGDEYTDLTGTGYGGLAHTATLSGSWTTIDDKLAILTNNKEAVSISDFTTDTWNGSAQISFTLAQLANNERAGIVFRAQDKDNLDYVMYNQAADRLECYQRRAGTDFPVDSSGFLSWSGSLVERHLRVEFYYSRIKAYYSTDGITWTLGFSALVSGQPQPLNEFHQAGSVGILGKGFSDQDTWSGDPGSISSPTLPPYLNPDVNNNSGLFASTVRLAIWMHRVPASGTSSLYIPDSTGTLFTEHTFASIGINGLLAGAVVDPWSPQYTIGAGGVNGWVLTKSEVRRIEDIAGSRTLGTAFGLGLVGGDVVNSAVIHTHIAQRNHVVVGLYITNSGTPSRNGLWVYRTIDGTNWVGGQINTNTALGLYSNGSLIVSPHIPGVVFTHDVIDTAGRLRHRILKSTDYGATFSAIYTMPDPGGGPASYEIEGLYLPYHNNSDDGVIYYSYHNWNHDSLIYRYDHGTVTNVSTAALHAPSTNGGMDFSSTDRTKLRAIPKQLNVLSLDAGTSSGPSKSNDSGASWTASTPTDYAHFRSIAVAGDNLNIQWAWGSAGALVQTLNDQANWSDVSGNLPGAGATNGDNRIFNIWGL